MVNEIVAGGLDAIFITIMVVIIIFMLVFSAWFIWFFTRFKNQILLRIKTKGETDLIYIDKFRYVKKKGETEKIQLWKTKQFKPVPPPEAKDFTKKGKEYVEAYLNDTGEIQYILTTQKVDTKAEKSVLDSDDKEFYANAYFEAQRHKKKGVLEWISENAGLIALVLMFIMVIAFWEDITKPMVKVSSQNQEIAQQNAEILSLAIEICKDKQILQQEELNGEGGTPPN